MIFGNKATKDTPFYEFKHGILTMEGNIYPNDSTEFWMPIINELEYYVAKREPIIINFKFDYYNTASMYYIDLLFRILNGHLNIDVVTVNWYYRENDEDMQIYGEDYRDSSKIKNFRLIEIKK